MMLVLLLLLLMMMMMMTIGFRHVACQVGGLDQRRNEGLVACISPAPLQL
jgi:hypothetical protein